MDRLSPKIAVPEFLPRTLAHYTAQLAKLGGCLARKGDPLPGNTVMWRGLTRLTDRRPAVALRGRDLVNLSDRLARPMDE